MPVSSLIVRADASVAIGTGHVMRCLALGQAWQDAGGTCLFAMAEGTTDAERRLNSEGIRVIHLEAVSGSAQDAAQLADLARAHKADWVVVDGYKFREDCQQSVKEAGIRLLFVDDYGHANHYCADLVLNQNADSGEDLYAHREPHTGLLLGPRYALLRREFAAWREWQRTTSAVGRRVLVTMGGSDPDNVSALIIQALCLVNVPGLEVIVVVGGSNPHRSALERTATQFGQGLRLEDKVWNMAELMAWADVAVCAAGTTLWEICMLGLPAIVIPVADNQRLTWARLTGFGAVKQCVYPGAHFVEALGEALTQLLISRDERLAMSAAGRAIVDGHGTTRVLRALGVEP